MVARRTRRMSRRQAGGGFFDFLFGSSNEKKNISPNAANSVAIDMPDSVTAPISANAPNTAINMPSNNYAVPLERVNVVGGKRRRARTHKGGKRSQRKANTRRYKSRRSRRNSRK